MAFRTKKGPEAAFSLVELMVAVAIVAVLAAIAIPVFATLQSRAKLAEAPPNVRSLADAGQAAMLGVEGFQPADYKCQDDGWCPFGNPSRQLHDWVVTDPGSQAGWAALGWTPDGAVRCGYYPALDQGVSHVNLYGAACDTDGDNVQAKYFIQYDSAGNAGSAGWSPGPPSAY